MLQVCSRCCVAHLVVCLKEVTYRSSRGVQQSILNLFCVLSSKLWRTEQKESWIIFLSRTEGCWTLFDLTNCDSSLTLCNDFLSFSKEICQILWMKMISCRRTLWQKLLWERSYSDLASWKQSLRAVMLHELSELLQHWESVQHWCDAVMEYHSDHLEVMWGAQNQVDGVNVLVKLKLVLRHNPKTASMTALSVGSSFLESSMCIALWCVTSEHIHQLERWCWLYAVLCLPQSFFMFHHYKCKQV